MSYEERVVLLDDEGRGIGAASKSEVHGADTPLHLAFSCYLFDVHGRVLVTRRALGKSTWPGTWTNSFCGHPQPFESIPDAVERRAGFELGVTFRNLRLLLPDFRYRAVDASGMVENELCPVYSAITDADPILNSAEVMDARWTELDALMASVRLSPWAFSPWMGYQLQQLNGRDLFERLQEQHG